MSQAFVGEIQIFAFTFAPRGWAQCNGQLLPISQNTALFSLLGTFYGGDGRSTFGLPNLQGNIPISYGQGPGLSLYDIGETGGSATVTLLASEVPVHSHTLPVTSVEGHVNTPSGSSILGATGSRSQQVNSYATSPNGNMAPLASGVNVGGNPHNNLAPYVVLNYCIAMQGVFPPRQ